MHALIIEDQFLVAAFIEDVLRTLGYTSFDTVDREEDAIRVAEERCPDLIMADRRLTDGSGVNAVRVICATRAIPVVFISEYRIEVRKLAPDAVLIGKPFGERTLRDAVEQAIVLVSRSVDEAG
jgi:two-component system, response regulator PdtaR